MSRLTERDKNGIVIMIRPQEANNKLAELEDVLEEFRIESVQKLKARLQSESQLASAGYKLALENEDLTKQLSKAIVPKFEIGQEVWFIDTRVNSFNEQRDVLGRYLVDSIVFTKEQIRYYGDDGLWLGDNEAFKTKAEAQAKLDEIRRK